MPHKVHKMPSSCPNQYFLTVFTCLILLQQLTSSHCLFFQIIILCFLTWLLLILLLSSPTISSQIYSCLILDFLQILLSVHVFFLSAQVFDTYSFKFHQWEIDQNFPESQISSKTGVCPTSTCFSLYLTTPPW